ncbi:hypothetical protein TNCV_3147451 [Trichonephila clavipes]|nr:hypothetical protein TNCV_3147451 [Trichonephila clavipes]
MRQKYPITLSTVFLISGVRLHMEILITSCKLMSVIPFSVARQASVGLGLLKKPFQATLVHASVLQFLVLKTRISFSRSSIYQYLACPFFVYQLVGVEDFFSSSAVFEMKVNLH